MICSGCVGLLSVCRVLNCDRCVSGWLDKNSHVVCSSIDNGRLCVDEGSEPGVNQGSVSSVVLQIDRLLTFSLVSGSGVGAEWLEATL